MHLVFILEERLDQDSVDLHVVTYFGEDFMQAFHLLLVQTVLRVKENRNFVWRNPVKGVLFETRGRKDQVNIVNESNVLNLGGVDLILIYSLESFSFIWSNIYSK